MGWTKELMGAELAAEVERIILSWVCSLLIAGEEKAAGLELVHLLLPGQGQCDRLHRYTSIKSIHLSAETQAGAIVQHRLSIAAWLPVHAAAQWCMSYPHA